MYVISFSLNMIVSLLDVRPVSWAELSWAYFICKNLSRIFRLFSFTFGSWMSKDTRNTALYYQYMDMWMGKNRKIGIEKENLW